MKITATIAIVLSGLAMVAGSAFLASPEDTVQEELPGTYLEYLVNFEQVLNGQNYDDLGDYLAEDWMLHDTQYEHRYGADGYHDWVNWYHELMPDDFEYSVQGRETIDNMQVVIWIISGTHTGEVDGIPATGNPIRIQGVFLHHFDDNELKESWIQYNEQRFRVLIGLEDSMYANCENDERQASCV